MDGENYEQIDGCNSRDRNIVYVDEEGQRERENLK